MKLVIDIDEDTYNDIMNWSEFNVINIGLKLREIAQNGILLPKGHGRLIDVDELLTSERPRGITDDIWKESHIYKLLSNAPTIIEADKGE